MDCVNESVPGRFCECHNFGTGYQAGFTGGAHRVQQDWLDASQGMNSYLLAMEEMSLELGKHVEEIQVSGRLETAFAFGFCGRRRCDPLTKMRSERTI